MEWGAEEGEVDDSNHVAIWFFYSPISMFKKNFLTIGVNWGERVTDWMLGVVVKVGDDSDGTNCIMFTDSMV